jgi:hypothetical protein
VDKASWLSGLCNTFGILGTAASMLTVDHFGRRESLYFGFFIQGTVLLSGALPRLGELHSCVWRGFGCVRVHVHVLFRADSSDDRFHLPDGDLAGLLVVGQQHWPFRRCSPR